MSRPMDWTSFALAGRRSQSGGGQRRHRQDLDHRRALPAPVAGAAALAAPDRGQHLHQCRAAELGERLRGKLLWRWPRPPSTRDNIASDEGRQSDCSWIRKRWRDQPAALEREVQRLQAALAEFDAAPIATLHALCSRILAEHPFAAGALFRGSRDDRRQDAGSRPGRGSVAVIAQGDESDELGGLARAAEITLNALKYVPVLLHADVVVAGVDPDAFRDRGDSGDPDFDGPRRSSGWSKTYTPYSMRPARRGMPDVASAIAALVFKHQRSARH